MIELVVAISVILIGVVSTLVLTTTTIRGGTASKMQVIAANLAREGIEVARMQRDNNWLAIESNDLAPYQWDSGLKNGTDYTAIAVFDPDSDPPWSLDYALGDESLDVCINDLDRNCQLYFQDGIYSHDSSGEPTPYYRLIQTYEICYDPDSPPFEPQFGTAADDCTDLIGEDYEKIGIQVLSQVRWQEKNNWQDLVFEDHLYNWK